MSTIKSLFGHKASINRQLFSALDKVNSELHSNEVNAALDILNHIYIVDRIFRAHLLGEEHGYSAAKSSATPGLAELQSNVIETDAWYADYASSISNDQLGESIEFTFTDGDAGTLTREEILLHVITHGSNHRGNVSQILKSISAATPRDLYTKYLHESEPARRRELTTLSSLPISVSIG
jgi:uncharacterized damage-inducible protein DinB